MRISLLPNIRKELILPFLTDLKIPVNTLSLEEVYGGKIKSLITRGALRDLFDVYSLLENNIEIKKPILKKIVVFFGCLDREDFRTSSLDNINNIAEKEIKSNLVPLLRKKISVSKNKMIKKVKPLLEGILKLNKNEKEYMDKFFKGEFKPELLFEGEKINIDDLKNHPMVLWKQQHIKEWLKNKSNK